MIQQHGGDLDAAMQRFGGAEADWVDLSTGINPQPYPMPALTAGALAKLPTISDVQALEAAAAAAYRTRAAVLPVAGAQAAIQLVPRLRKASQARVLGPTYSEHRIALKTAGWRVDEVSDLDALKGAGLAVVVSPNNPDGRTFAPETLLSLAEHVGLLVVDESFVDTTPESSICPHLTENTGHILALRSFGKFYGLAGLRLGFVIGADALITPLRHAAGPWQVSGPAILAGTTALADEAWASATRARLSRDAARLDALATRAGWQLIGGTPLFRTYYTLDAAAAQTQLASAHVWSRIFPYSPHWLRLGLPGSEQEWQQVSAALAV